MSILSTEFIALLGATPGASTKNGKAGTAELDVYAERDGVYAVREVNTPPAPGGGKTSSWLDNGWVAVWCHDILVGDRVVLTMRRGDARTALIDLHVADGTIRGVAGCAGQAPSDTGPLSRWCEEGWRAISVSAVGDINDRLAVLTAKVGDSTVHTVLLDVYNWLDVRRVLVNSSKEEHPSLNAWLNNGWSKVTDTNIGRVGDRRVWLLRKEEPRARRAKRR